MASAEVYIYRLTMWYFASPGAPLCPAPVLNAVLLAWIDPISSFLLVHSCSRRRQPARKKPGGAAMLALCLHLVSKVAWLWSGVLQVGVATSVGTE